MSAWKNICCAVDFSAASRVALEEAAELAWRYGGSLTLLNVRERPPVPVPDATLQASDRARGSSEWREQELEAWREYAARIATTQVAAVVLEGRPATEIVRFAADHRCDVVVMGTHGRSGRDGRPLGSVAQEVILDAGCPVVVLHARPQRPVAIAHSSAGSAP